MFPIQIFCSLEKTLRNYFVPWMCMNFLVDLPFYFVLNFLFPFPFLFCNLNFTELIDKAEKNIDLEFKADIFQLPHAEGIAF